VVGQVEAHAPSSAGGVGRNLLRVGREDWVDEREHHGRKPARSPNFRTSSPCQGQSTRAVMRGPYSRTSLLILTLRKKTPKKKKRHAHVAERVVEHFPRAIMRDGSPGGGRPDRVYGPVKRPHHRAPLPVRGDGAAHAVSLQRLGQVPTHVLSAVPRFFVPRLV
jgi:hypothetical protein